MPNYLAWARADFAMAKRAIRTAHVSSTPEWWRMAALRDLRRALSIMEQVRR